MTKHFNPESFHDSFANRVVPRYVWSDLELPSDLLDQLMDVCNYVNNNIENLETHTLTGQTCKEGLKILFRGLPGTGKTMAAEIIANELKLDLYKIDLSEVVSKYIGETEKNLRRLFDAAEESGAVLFFDEADALFGNRSEVKDTHDRYADVEVNYLLSKLATCKGTIIFAVNNLVPDTINTAFMRRMRFVVDFPFPNKDARCAIWERILSNKTNFKQVDFETLALLPLTGGDIKNVTALATSVACEKSSKKIVINHIIEAIVRYLLNSKLSKTETKDLDLVLIELFEYMGDELSKLQDAVAKEAYIGTARRRRKVMRNKK